MCAEDEDDDELANSEEKPNKLHEPQKNLLSNWRSRDENTVFHLLATAVAAASVVFLLLILFFSDPRYRRSMRGDRCLFLFRLTNR